MTRPFQEACGRRGQIAVLPGDLADAGIDRRIEGFDGCAAFIDANDLADLQPDRRLQADALSEAHVPRKPGDAERGGRDLRDDAADAGPGERRGGARNATIEDIEAVGRSRGSGRDFGYELG